MPSWAWDWGWNGGISGLAAFGVIIGLAIYLVPLFFFLLNLRNLLEKVDVRNRAMSPENVWLNFIPVFNLGWSLYTVTKVRDSVRDEYRSRGWSVDSDLGYNVGVAAGILLICSVVLGWVPVIGFGLSVAFLVCWVIYWLKTNDLKNRLGATGTWAGPAGYGPGSDPGGFYPGGPGPGGPGSYSRPTGPMGGAYPPTGPAPASQAPQTPQTPGAPGTQPMRCGACGATILAGDRFCQSCGLRLPQRSGPAAEPAAAADTAAADTATADPPAAEPTAAEPADAPDAPADKDEL